LHGDEAAGDQSGGRAAVVLSQAVRKATSDEGEPAAEDDAAKRRWSKRRGRGRWRRRMGLGDGKGKGSRMKKCAVFGGSARAVHNGTKHQARLLAALAGPGSAGWAMISMETEEENGFNADRLRGDRSGEEEETRRLSSHTVTVSLSRFSLSLPQNPQRCLLVSCSLLGLVQAAAAGGGGR